MPHFYEREEEFNVVTVQVVLPLLPSRRRRRREEEF